MGADDEIEYKGPRKKEGKKETKKEDSENKETKSMINLWD